MISILLVLLVALLVIVGGLALAMACARCEHCRGYHSSEEEQEACERENLEN